MKSSLNPSSIQAAIDIGTNSVHLVVARIDSKGNFRILDTDKATIRLGQYLTVDGAISKRGIEKAAQTIKHMVEICEAYDCKIRAVATFAVRQAVNHQEFVDSIFETSGVKVDVIDGIEEARLVYLGIRQSLRLEKVTALSVDIGGGSTEIIIARGDDIKFVTSLKMGAVTLSRQFFQDKQVPSEKDVRKLREYIDLRIAPILAEIKDKHFAKAIASSGTAKAIASAISLKYDARSISDVHGQTIARAKLESFCKKLSQLRDPKKIKDFFGVDSARSDIILAGSLILESITRSFGVKEWQVSSYGLREGLVVDSVNRILHETNATPREDDHDIRWRNVDHLMDQLAVDQSQARRVCTTSLKIFDVVFSDEGLINLNEEEWHQDRETLQTAALLHEVGKFLSMPAYHKHSAYIIANSRLLGYSRDERQFIALISRFHRKGAPVFGDPEFKFLSRRQFQKLQILSAILRLSVALHRTRNDKFKISDVSKIKQSLTIQVAAPVSSYDVSMLKIEQERSIIEAALQGPVRISLRKHRYTE